MRAEDTLLMKMYFRGKALLERRAFPRTPIPKKLQELASSRWSLDRVAFSWLVVIPQLMGVHYGGRKAVSSLRSGDARPHHLR